MSWYRGLKNQPQPSASSLRQEKRDKLEAERQERAQRRAELQKQFQSARQAREEADQALKDFRDIDPDIFDSDSLIPDNTVAEDILDDSSNDSIMAANFDTENETDGDKVMDKLSGIQCPFNKSDINFWFTEFECQMEVIEVKAQWTKRVALQRFLPIEIKEDVKTLLQLQKNQAGNDIYFRIKSELLTLFGSKPEDSYNKAKNRVMTGKPSQLGKLLVNDICDNAAGKFNGCCCAKTVWGMYREKIPVVIRNHVAQLQFNKDTYMQIFTISDQIYDSNQSSEPMSNGQAVAAVTSETKATPEVAATSVRRPQRNQRNQQNRGQNGNRGGNSNNSNRTSTNTNNNSSTSQPATGQNKGPKHATARGDSDKLCKIHYRWGENGNFCAAPWKCPMKDIYKAPQ